MQQHRETSEPGAFGGSTARGRLRPGLGRAQAWLLALLWALAVDSYVVTGQAQRPARDGVRSTPAELGGVAELAGPPKAPESPELKDPWDKLGEGDQFRHEGFFLRFALGGGGGVLRGKRDAVVDEAVTFSGFGVSGVLSAGLALADNFLIHGDVFFTSMLDANMDGGFQEDVDGYEFRGDLSMLMPGIGVSYYLMPFNLYLSSSVGIGQVVWERYDGERQTSRYGVAVQGLLGKEWWVDPQWGVGVAAQCMFLTASDARYSRVDGLSFSLLVSATYN